MRRSSTIIYCIYAFTFALLHSNCSTNKSGFAHRAYHNTTAHYNGYFNGRESFRAGVAQIKTGYTEDYTNILPVFIYGDENAAKSAYPQMDKAIEKCEKVIQRHSIYIKREEYVDWIDDCWFLIGQCHFYKQEYAEAKEKFEYVARQFQEKEIHFEASIWLARTYLQMHNYAKTGKVLDLIREDEGFPLKLKAEYSAVYADYYIRQHNYLLAIPEIRNAIANEKNRKKRVRYLFILAQFYQQEGNYTKASDYFAQVARMNPPYEMEFYAKINRALSYDVGSGNKEEIKKELGKMLRDGKNSDYYDQIYYALAEVYFREGEQDMGIELLKKSVA
ncbi:MAG: tetratricopeptide repeat protein, partial [Flavobacteriales bacterium]